MRTAIVALEDVPPAQWRELIPADSPTGFYATPQWQRTTMAFDGVNAFALCAWDGRQQVAAVVPFFKYSGRVPNPNIDPGSLTNSTGSAWEPVTLVGSASYATNQIARDSPSWLAAVKAALATNDDLCAMPYVDTPTMTMLRASFPQARAILTPARAVVDVHRSSLAEHLQELTGSQRNQMRGDFRKFAAGNRSITSSALLNLLDSDIGELGRTISATMSRHGLTDDPDAGLNYLKQLLESEVAADAVVFTCWDDAGQALAHSLCFRWGKSLVLRGVGLDYARTGQHGEYGHVLVHAPVAYAMQHGLTSVELGVGVERAKVSRGAKLTATWTVLFDPPADWDQSAIDRLNAAMASDIMRAFGRHFSPHDADFLATLASRDGEKP